MTVEDLIEAIERFLAGETPDPPILSNTAVLDLCLRLKRLEDER